MSDRSESFREDIDVAIRALNATYNLLINRVEDLDSGVEDLTGECLRLQAYEGIAKTACDEIALIGAERDALREELNALKSRIDEKGE